MPEREINLAQVVVIAIILLAVILGIVFGIIIPTINKTKQSGTLDFACTAYEGDVGCNNKACGVNYDSAACQKILENVKITVKDVTIELWKECKNAGLTDPKNCQIKCCGLLIVGRGEPCSSETVQCASGLRCDDATKTCVTK